MTHFGMKPQEGKTKEHKPFVVHKKYNAVNDCENIGSEIITLVKAALANPNFPLEVDNGQLFLRVDIAFQVEPNTIPPADFYEIKPDGSIVVDGKPATPKPKAKKKPTVKATAKKKVTKKGGK